ncbi:DNA-binding pseudobarrel domain-containing protein [Artemisia annua]|uniref:DNA-binding pseudobarrel domain-containing protein n=1 Tax=Artemisia annua TaxID=35608 RepID=A0A2U1PFW3_ARTAN|nr:DNA-binding pseudobarrel domain-containing protein [Artemisia annua]
MGLTCALRHMISSWPPLPPKFVKKHLGNKILEDPLIKSENGGYLWKLKMKKISDHSYCLVDGWCNVVKDVGLLFGEFLLFIYVGSSVFLMHVYSVNGCEKILVPKIKVPSFKVVDYGSLARIDTRETITLENYDGSGKEMSVQSDKKSKSTSYYVAAGWKEFQRSNDISEGDKCVFKFITSEDKICLVKITKKKTPARPLAPASDMDRMPEEFVRSAGIDSKKTLTLRSLDGYEMAMPVQFDTQYGYHTKRYFLLKGWKDFVRASNISKGDKCVFKFITSEDKLCLANITKPPPAAEALETEVNDNDENENEDIEPVDDVDPFFVVTITTGHISRLYLPTDFVGLSGIDTKENIIMISLDGSESQMAVWKGKRQPASTRYHLTEGWNAFMHRNNISKGDKCVFKYITSEDKMCLAKIIKALATEVDVDDMDPSFVVTISITQKHMLRLPPDFVALARIDTKENIIMKSLDGNESQMAVRPDKRFKSARYNLSLGWVAFKQNNNISQGDECVFKYITSEDKMCLLKVTKASATEVDDGMDVEDDNDTDEDENAKLVDDADPFFVVTITTTHKTMLLLPTDFVALARIGTKKNVIIKSLDGIETQMALQSYKLRWSTRYCFSVGWRSFKRSNNISDGDECVFKYIKSEDKMCLAKITKKITRATQLPAERLSPDFVAIQQILQFMLLYPKFI